MSEYVTDARPRSGGVSRRTVVRAGAHAAWAVPAVTVVTALPAHGVTVTGTTTSVVTPTFGTTSRNKTTSPQTVTIPLSVSNDGQIDVSSVQVSIALSDTTKVYRVHSLQSISGDGWTAEQVNGGYLLTYGGNLTPGADSSVATLKLNVSGTITGTDNSKATVTATTSGTEVESRTATASLS